MTDGKLSNLRAVRMNPVDMKSRVLAIMPHPERSTLFASWAPEGKAAEWGQTLPWQRLFYSARRWVSI